MLTKTSYFQNSSLFSDRLACPSVRWLGIHPSDIRLLGIQHKNLAEMDTRRLSHLISRPYVRENERIRKEVFFTSQSHRYKKIY